MTAQPTPSITIDEYLAGERISDIKHEYYAGKVFAHAGGSSRHNLITMNIAGSLHGQVRKRQCHVYSSDMRVKVSKTGLYTYPDIAVVCGTIQFEDDHEDTLLNPLVIIEVLSPSTESYDRGKKFQHYRTIESLKEYLLVAQDTCRIEHYIRQPDDQWLLSEINTLEATLQLPSIDCALTLTDVYEKIDISPAEA